MHIAEKMIAPFTFQVSVVGDDGSHLGMLRYRRLPAAGEVEGFLVDIPEENRGQGVFTEIMNYLVERKGLFEPDGKIDVNVDGEQVAMGSKLKAVDATPEVTAAIQSVFSSINKKRPEAVDKKL